MLLMDLFSINIYAYILYMQVIYRFNTDTKDDIANMYYYTCMFRFTML